MLDSVVDPTATDSGGDFREPSGPENAVAFLFYVGAHRYLSPNPLVSVPGKLEMYRIECVFEDGSVDNRAMHTHFRANDRPQTTRHKHGPLSPCLGSPND